MTYKGVVCVTIKAQERRKKGTCFGEKFLYNVEIKLVLS